MTSALPDRLHAQLNSHAAAGLVLAVSGGADSIALVAAVHTCGWPRVVIAHLDHRLRPNSSADADWVRDWATARGVPSVIAARDQPLVGNVESAARSARYAWLAEVACAHNCAWVVTAHTADDQAETILHRLLRGTGLNGLRGIARQRPLTPTVTLLRPLLDTTRAEVLAYLREQGQEFLTDPTNADTRLTRNRIRHELLPMLRTYNPQVNQALQRLATQTEAVYADLAARALALLAQIECPRAGAQCVFRVVPAEMPNVVRCEMFRQVWLREGWPLGGMGQREWDRLLHVEAGHAPAVDLPGRIRARRRGVVLLLGRIG
jgi:tRNA(Ile)-lysidine synthase